MADAETLRQHVLNLTQQQFRVGTGFRRRMQGQQGGAIPQCPGMNMVDVFKLRQKAGQFLTQRGAVKILRPVSWGYNESIVMKLCTYNAKATFYTMTESVSPFYDFLVWWRHLCSFTPYRYCAENNEQPLCHCQQIHWRDGKKS